jgi:hypothetical protein
VSSANNARAADRDELFAYEARRDGRTIVRLRGTRGDGSAVTVLAEVTPAGADEPTRRPFAFTTREHAMRFVDEALATLEYIGCTVL